LPEAWRFEEDGVLGGETGGGDVPALEFAPVVGGLALGDRRGGDVGWGFAGEEAEGDVSGGAAGFASGDEGTADGTEADLFGGEAEDGGIGGGADCGEGVFVFVESACGVAGHDAVEDGGARGSGGVGLSDGVEWEVAEPVDFDAGENGWPFAAGFGVPELVDGGCAEDDEEVSGVREEAGDVASEEGEVSGEADGGEPWLVGDCGDAAFVCADGEGGSGWEETGAVAVGEEDGGSAEWDDEVWWVILVDGGEEFDERLFAVGAIESGTFEGSFGEFDGERGLGAEDVPEFLSDGVERGELAAEGVDDEDVAGGGGGGRGWSGVAVGGDEEGAEESDVEETRHGWGGPTNGWHLLIMRGSTKNQRYCGWGLTNRENRW
jgi:hypothetical protein